MFPISPARLSLLPMAKNRQDTILFSGTGIINIQNQRQDTKIGTGIATVGLFGRPTRPINNFPPLPPIITNPRPKAPFMPLIPSFGGGRSTTERGRGAQRKYGYQPSFTANVLNIYGSKPRQKIFSGFELRPIPTGELNGNKKKRKGKVFSLFS